MDVPKLSEFFDMMDTVPAVRDPPHAVNPGRLRGLVLLARLELVRVLQVVERASTAPGVQRTGEVAVSVAVAVWDEDPGYRGGEAGAAGTRWSRLQGVGGRRAGVSRAV